MSTLKDVAKYAKVSIATVSHYLNNTKNLKPETKQAIEEAILKTKYQYNAQAANLKRTASKELKNLGLISLIDKNPFFQELYFALERQARRLGICVLSSFLHSDDLKSDFAKSLDLLRHNSDLILVNVIDGDSIAFALDEVKTRSCVLFAVNEAKKFKPRYPLEWEQNAFMGAYLIAKHLLNEKASTFAILSGPAKIKVVQERLEGFKKAVQEAEDHKISFKVYEGDFSYLSGQNLLLKLVQEGFKPDAIICHNDLMATGVLSQALKLGLKIPQEVKLTGYDGIELGRLISPSLTTINIDLDDLAKQILTSCKSIYKDEEQKLGKLISYPTLEVRESS